MNSINKDWNADYMAACLSSQGQKRGQAVHVRVRPNTNKRNEITAFFLSVTFSVDVVGVGDGGRL